MEEDILREILQEMKGFRSDLNETNNRVNNVAGGLNNVVESISETNRRLDGLTASMVVLQQGFSDMRFELIEIKKFLADRVIWNNDSVSIDAESGSKIQGVIHKRGKL